MFFSENENERKGPRGGEEGWWGVVGEREETSVSDSLSLFF